MSECDSPVAPSAPENPISMNVNITASGEKNVNDLLKLMKDAGLGDAEKVTQKSMPMRKQMDKYLSIMDDEVQEDDEGYGTTPGEVYQDSEYMTHNISGGINKMKKAYADAEDGDNAMAVKKVKEQLLRALAEKSAKPDFLDLDGDGDTKEPMKKAARDKKSKKNNKK